MLLLPSQFQKADIPPATVDATTNNMVAIPDVAEATPFARSSSLSAATTGSVEFAIPSTLLAMPSQHLLTMTPR